MSISYGGDQITFPDTSTQNTAATGFGFKNRIINGAMVIDQRNAGASVTPTASGTYTLDRWRTGLSVTSKYSVQQNAGPVTPPSGFSNYLGITSLSAYSVLSGDAFFVGQRIEGFNTADLAFGTASAQTTTVSFWVRSSLTGTFCVAIGNSAFTRSYVATYTVSAANTWEQKSITVPGDTTGTWAGSTNGVGLYMNFTLGAGSTYNTTANTWMVGEFYGVSGAVSVVGTSGATFYITGVQLEKGSTATAFDYRDYGRELMMCQRYYYRRNIVPNTDSVAVLQAYSSGNAYGKLCDLPVTMRATPTGGISAIGSFAGQTATGNLAGAFTAGAVNFLNPNSIGTAGFSGGSGLAAGNAMVLAVTSAAWIDATAEL